MVTPIREKVQDLRDVLNEVDLNSCPTRYNFHLHTTFSDGQMTPAQLVDQVTQLGLKGFTITDHHTVAGYWQARTLLKSDRDQPQLWTGVEITAELCGSEVHILGYDFDPFSPAMQPFLQGKSQDDLPAASAIAALHLAGGIAVLAHPFRYTRPATLLVESAVSVGIDGLEVYYCYKNPDPWVPSPDQTQAAEMMAQSHGLLKTCGTDSHGLTVIRRL